MSILTRIANKLCIIWYQVFEKRYFEFMGNNVLIIWPLRIDGSENISLGNHVHINYKTWLAAMPLTGENCKLMIGEGTVIGNFNHIYATQRIVIGRKVLIADKVYISDNLHAYEDIHIPVMDQSIKQIGEVSVGDGTWIGENAVILGAKIGKNCVVGANAVVTSDIPDFCVVAGVPARIIKRFHLGYNKWMQTSSDGEFLTI